ncbi:hypothetical protein I302_105920 [Kwoniella bestiolae CBS 10118]|uniref:Uncharacterized protein n=1 Tax=Kwoniella bestiolae CBS 10118 TaxID=1296100 RepID=A0A1B9G2J3_9TREE|nr:hypothetical protein I302_05044 [Kwoniella bestiolae CBS 10118]OCF25231.1 hypothetical protein I302_05044 [Kwoniella bestiolae CBS 10118]
MAPHQSPLILSPDYTNHENLSIAVSRLFDEIDVDLARRARIYDLIILCIGIAIGLVLYSLTHDLIIFAQERASSRRAGSQHLVLEDEHEEENSSQNGAEGSRLIDVEEKA